MCGSLPCGFTEIRLQEATFASVTSTPKGGYNVRCRSERWRHSLGGSTSASWTAIFRKVETGRWWRASIVRCIGLECYEPVEVVRGESERIEHGCVLITDGGQGKLRGVVDRVGSVVGDVVGGSK